MIKPITKRISKGLVLRGFAFYTREHNYQKEVNSKFINTTEYDCLSLKNSIKPKKLDRRIDHLDNDDDEEEDINYKVQFDYLREVEARTVQYINEYLDDYVVGIDTLDLKTSFTELEIDSLLKTELVIYVENSLGIRFGDTEALEIETIYDLVILAHRYYSEKRNKQALQVIKNKEIAARARFNKKFNI